MKYLIMECHPAYAVALSEDGMFRKVANMHYEIGQTVTDVILLNLPEEAPVRKQKPRWLKTVAAAAACLTLAVTSFFYAGTTPYASVYLTINPQVRVDVNRRDTVVAVEGMNPDGQKLLEEYEHKGKDLDLVMDELVDLAIDRGYLHEGGKITLSLEADDSWVENHSTHLNDQLSDHLAEKITVTIDVEQKQIKETVPEPTIPAKPIVIPVSPGSYGNSDYDDKDDGKSDYDKDDEDDDKDDEDDDRDDDKDDDKDDDRDDDKDDDRDSEGQTDYDRDDDEDETDYKSPVKQNSTQKTSKSSDYDDKDDGETDNKEPEKQDTTRKPSQSDDDDDDDDDGDSEYEKKKN